MKFLKKKPAIVSVAVMLALQGCVSTSVQNGSKKIVSDAAIEVKDSIKKINASFDPQSALKEQEVGTPFLFGNAVPVAREVTLPRALQRNIKTHLMFTDKETDSWISLATFGERVTRATGILVSIAPDVYLPDADLLPRQADAQAASAPGTGKPMVIQQPMVAIPLAKNADEIVTDQRPGRGANGRPETVYGFYFPRTEAQLGSLLDSVTTKFHIHHRYDESTNTIYIYRLITRHFQTKLAGSSYSFASAQIGDTVKSTDNNSLANGSTSQSKSPIGTEIKEAVELTSMKKAIEETIMTRAGKIFANPSTGTISMIDTEEAVNAADVLIQSELKATSRSVVLKVKTIQVNLTDNLDSGFDLTAVLTKAFSNLPDMALNTKAPTSVVSTNAGSLNLGIFSGTAANSKAVIDALKEVGDVSVSTEMPFITKNRKAIYYNLRQITSYVPNTTPAAATTGGTGGNIGLNTAQIQTGLKLVMFPALGADDSASISFTMDETTKPILTPFSSGSGATFQQVEKANYEGHGNIQDVSLKSGQSMILVGFEQIAENLDKRSLGDNIPLIAGGSISKKHSHTLTLVQLSMQIVD